ncbi:uncharacterized protein [Macrobrachium rosenbergii]|uniref:uncharacterized protein n=1 Tax=Macrobrachium rosenbergii TaxID=79674 RepID=UPI0034D42BAB
MPQVGQWGMVSKQEDLGLLSFWDLDGSIIQGTSNPSQQLYIFNVNLTDLKNQPKDLKNESSSSWNTPNIITIILSGMDPSGSVATSCGTPASKQTSTMRRWLAGVCGADDYF